MKTIILKRNIKYLEKVVENDYDDVEESKEVLINQKKNSLIINLPNESPKNNQIPDSIRVERNTTKKIYLNDYYASKKDELLEKAKLILK